MGFPGYMWIFITNCGLHGRMLERVVRTHKQLWIYLFPITCNCVCGPTRMNVDVDVKDQLWTQTVIIWILN